MFAALLAKFGLPLLVNVVGGALARIDNPVAKAAADGLNAVSGAISAREISPEQVAEANRHVEAIAKTESEESREAFREINATMRAEASSEDQYVRRWRPFWGYVTAWCWSAQTGIIVVAVLAATGMAIFGHVDRSQTLLAGLAGLIEALTTQWAVALTVLGVATYQRTREKMAASGVTPVGMFAALATRLASGPPTGKGK